MRFFKRYQVDKGPVDLFGKMVNVVGDPEWVDTAIREAWFSVSKSRGVWRVFLPYTMIFDIPGRESIIERTKLFYQVSNRVLDDCGVKYRLRDPNNGYLEYWKVRFACRKQVDQFVLMMQLHSFTYIPSKQIEQGI